MIEIILEIDGWCKYIQVSREIFYSGVINIEMPWENPLKVLNDKNAKPVNAVVQHITFIKTGFKNKRGIPVFKAEL